MLDTVSKEMLFATPLLRYRIPDHEALDAALLETGAKLRAESEGIVKSNRGGWHSEGNLFDVDAPAIATLHKAADEAVRAATRHVARKLDLDTLRIRISGWMNVNPPGGFNAPHTHPGAHWSGVYYVSQPPVDEGNSGMIEFLDPRSDLPNWRLLGARTFRPKRKIRPEAGEIVMFPSYLMHWVYPNDTADERVTIAFNATLKKKPGSDADSGDTED